MKVLRVGEFGREYPAVLDHGELLDLRPLVGEQGPAAWTVEMLESVAARISGLPRLALDPEVRIGAPIPRPGAIYCIGMNFAAHAAESGAEPPTVPVMFLKPPNTVIGPYDNIVLPRGSTATDWEVELGVVIGGEARYLESQAEAEAVIAGYVVANDVSERHHQLDLSGGQWSKGKSAPTFTPVGPWLVTPDEIDLNSLRLQSWVNREARQDATTGDMIFDVLEIIRHLSQFAKLEPGDLILTGTPQGVALSGRFPYLREGDRVETEIQGLGRQSQIVSA